MEHCSANRRTFLSTTTQYCQKELLKTVDVPALEAVTRVFLAHEKIANELDEELDNIQSGSSGKFVSPAVC